VAEKSIAKLHRVVPGTKVDLAEIDADGTPGISGKKAVAREKAEKELARLVPEIAALQYLLYAENQNAVLVTLQGMDTSGKDGVMRNVFSGLNPQGCHVTSFKKPSEAEADRDFLWRIHAAIPPKGEIGVFNRSHYEQVLIVRVHNLVPESKWSKYYGMINDFERYLTDNHVVNLKFFLHISKEEQRERLQARLDDPTKNWKFSPQDVEERKFWDDYQRAYEAALTKCSTEHSPWFIIPANKKWYRNWAIAKILHETLTEMDPKTPKPMCDLAKIKVV
jgi:PPK2 family polyphosphate:nucleotide phosphotransferase